MVDMAKSWGCITLLICFLAACGSPSETANLPTLAQLPTATMTEEAPPTLPATFTLTPTDTETPTPTLSATLSITPSATITETATATPTDTATFTPAPPDNEAINQLIALAEQATILPPDFLPAFTPGAVEIGTPGTVQFVTPGSVTCAYPPPGGFGAVYVADPTLAQQLGCPQGAPPITTSTSSASQPFERGSMIWLQGAPNLIYALGSNGRFQRFDDTYNPNADPFSGGETPPSGLREPVRGFGKVWRQYPNVRGDLGWALADESGGSATTLRFDRGQMLYLPQRGEILTLVEDPGGLTGNGRSFAGSA
jgi:hypothetical protein